MITNNKLHITTSAPEGITVALRIDHKAETAVAVCSDSVGSWTRRFDTLWECGQWVHSFGGVVTNKQLKRRAS